MLDGLWMPHSTGHITVPAWWLRPIAWPTSWTIVACFWDCDSEYDWLRSMRASRMWPFESIWFSVVWPTQPV